LFLCFLILDTLTVPIFQKTERSLSDKHTAINVYDRMTKLTWLVAKQEAC
jgi:hypothetical protein